MAGTTITDLTEGAITSNDDCFVIDTADGETVKIKYSDLITALLTKFVDSEDFDTAINNLNAKFSQYIPIQDLKTTVYNQVSYPITGSAVYNAIGGVNGLTFLQAYDSSVQYLSAGYVFTPQGAYSMYTNVMNTIPAIASQIAGSIAQSIITKVLPSQTTDFTIAVSDWVDGRATVAGTFNVGTGYLNDVVPTMGERATWNSCGVYPVEITAIGVTFECTTTPTTPLTFKVTQTMVSNPAAST